MSQELGKSRVVLVDIRPGWGDQCLSQILESCVLQLNQWLLWIILFFLSILEGFPFSSDSSGVVDSVSEHIHVSLLEWETELKLLESIATIDHWRRQIKLTVL